jgi:hypothetical protein
MDPSQAALQALIVETEALGWDFPKLDVIKKLLLTKKLLLLYVNY